MKITSIEAIPVSLPFRHFGPPTGFGGKIWTSLDHLLVAVHTDDGLTGWGEAFGSNVILAAKATIDHAIAPIIVGRDVTDVAALSRELEQTLHLFGSRQGICSYALSGIDIALWDLAGKVAGVPSAVVLGASLQRTEIEAYASMLRYRDSAVVKDVAEHALAEGYRAVKLHEVTAEQTRAGREAVGDDVALMLDVNCEWTLAEALAIAPELRELGLTWLEEPIRPHDGAELLARLRAVTGLRIAAGENMSTASEAKRFLDAGAVDVIQPSITKIGGASEFRRVAELATFYPVELAPHTPYFGPGLVATVQLAAGNPGVRWVERMYIQFDDDFYDGAFASEAGSFRVPDGPGFGIDPSAEAIARLRLDCLVSV